MALPAPPPASIPIPDELLEEIFIRLPTLDALACASAACTSFRRVIKGSARCTALPSSASWTRPDSSPPRLRTPPPRSPALSPRAPQISPSPRPSFLPTTSRRASKTTTKAPAGAPRDVRDGRVLLDWISLRPRVNNWTFYEDGSPVSFLMDSGGLGDCYDDGPRLAWSKRERCNAADFHLAVCDPLCRRYVLPTIPEELAAQPEDLLYEFQPVLAPATGDDGEELFKVICIARYKRKLVLFPSTTMQWCMVESPVRPFSQDMSYFDLVRGCFYWIHAWSWYLPLMVLDTRTLMFSVVNILTGYHLQLRDTNLSYGHLRRNAVVVGREGAIEMFSLVSQHGSFALHHTYLQDNSDEWNLEKIIQLPGQ